MYISKFTRTVAIPQNILGVVGVIYFYQNPPSVFWLWSIYFSWVIIGVFGVSTVYHKIYAHRSFEVRESLGVFLKIFTLFGMLCGQGSPLSYAAVHRNFHHPNSDQNERDPHSPKIHSFWHAYYGWHFKRFSYNFSGIRDLLSNRFLVWCHRWYNQFFLGAHIIIGILSFKFLIFCIVLPSLIHIHQMNILNSFSHKLWFGYRNFESEDDSVNNLVFGLLSWGTGFHNNHHAMPMAYHNQVRWYEFDPFKYIVPLIRKSDAKKV